MKSGEEDEFAVPRQAPDGELEGSDIVLAARGEVTRGHRQFVEVGEKAVQAVTSLRELVA
jgi:hypothetical protein